MAHQTYLNKSLKDVRFMYSRWACVTASKHVLSLYPKREPDEPQFWIEQAFCITAGICLIMDLFQRTDFNAEAQECLALVRKTVTYLDSFPTSSVAIHGVRVLTSLLQEYTKKLDAARGGAQSRPSTGTQASTAPMLQIPNGYDSTPVAEAGMVHAIIPMNPEVPLSAEATAAFNFDIDMLEFEDLLGTLPTEIGINSNVVYDSMLSAPSGSYDGWL